MKRKILTLGYIPKEKGGRQTTGLATGIFYLHDFENKISQGAEIIIAATDIFEKTIKIDHTQVFGWSFCGLLLYMVTHPKQSIYLLLLATKYHIKYYKVINIINIFGKMLFLNYAISVTKPDSVYVHGIFGAIISAGLFKKNLKVFLRIHGINGFTPSIPFYQTLRKIEEEIKLLKLDRVTFVTNAVYQEWIDRYGSFNCEMSAILNGYNSNVFYPISVCSTSKYNLITFSDVSENKGQLRVVEALVILKAEGISLSYLIIGSGDPKIINKIKYLTKLHSLDVTIMDYMSQKKINEYLDNSMFFILPSITEGFGQVYIESIGAGVPAIIPKHLPLAKEPDILSEENSFFLDDWTIEGITNGLRDLFCQRNTYDRYKVSKSVENLSWDKIAHQHSKIYFE